MHYACLNVGNSWGRQQNASPHLNQVACFQGECSPLEAFPRGDINGAAFALLYVTRDARLAIVPAMDRMHLPSTSQTASARFAENGGHSAAFSAEQVQTLRP